VLDLQSVEDGRYGEMFRGLGDRGWPPNLARRFASRGPRRRVRRSGSARGVPGRGALVGGDLPL